MDNQTDIGVTISTKINQAIQSASLLNSKLQNTQKLLQKLGISSSSINKSLSKTSTSGLRNVSNDAKKASSSMGMLEKKIQSATNGLQKGFSLGKLYWAFNTLKPVMNGLANIIQKSVDFTETVNLFSNAMGDLTGQAMTFQEKLSEAFGTAQTSMMNYQATYKNMLSALGGMSNQVTEKLSETLTLMSIDYASLYNVSMEDSAKKFQSALSRQVRPIRSTSGYDITQNVLADYLEQAGIYDREVSDLSEIEKRLLIIYSLQQQMANSNAFGDFARTIESPANQLRVLQEQIQEVGRWIGSVFYGTIGKVLPYINGFVMAIKEMVKWLALLVGYSVEDYASSGQTYFDQAFGDAGDILDDTSSGVSDVNSKLDDTKKKTKEIKEQLSGLDEINTINSTSESSSGSNNNGSGGGAGATVDPRLLNAIGQYDDMLDKVRMKANDIRDRLIEWGKIIGGYVNENIFKPMAISWDKYGESITSRFKSGFASFGSILEDAFGIVLKRIPETVSSVSSFVFSLIDDLAIAFDGLGKFFKGVWDNGGNVLFEQLIRLANAIIDLGTSINDNFVKPILKWFADDIAPTLGKVLGKILKLFGSLVGILADVTKKFAENKSAVKAVCTVLTTMFALYKTGQVVKKVTEWINVYKTFKNTGTTTLQFLNMFLGEHSKKYDALGNTIVSMSKSSNSAFDNIKTGLNTLKNVGSSVFSALTSSGASTVSVFPKLSSALEGAGSSAGFFLKAINAMTSPVGLALTGIVALSGAVMYLTRDYNGLTGSAKELNDAYVKQQKELDATTKEITKNQKATKDKISSIDSEYQAVERSISKLNEMVDANGKVNGSQKVAQELVDQINEKLGTNIQIQDGVIQNWKEEKDALAQTIEQMKQKAKIEAHYDDYVEALKRENSLSKELNSTKRTLANNEEQLSKKKKEYNELILKGSKMTDSEVEKSKKLAQEISDLSIQHEQLKKNVKSAQGAFEANQKSIEDYDLACNALSGEVSDMAKSMVADYETLDKKGQVTWKSLGQGLIDLTTKHQEYVAKGKDLNSQEVKANEEATKLIMQDMVKKANKYGYTFDDMLKQLSSKGVKLTKDEKAQLEEQYNNYSKHKDKVVAVDASKWSSMSSQTSIQMSGLNATQKRKLDEALNQFQESGDKQGLKYCEKLSKALENNGYLVDNDTKEIIDKIEKRAKNANPDVKVKTSLDYTSLSSVVGSISKTVGSVVSTIKLSLPKFATGGFPEDGMFMANHSELVGKFSNGRTAVANNTQIIEGIQGGVYKAVRDAMVNSQSGSNVIQVYIGKKKIAEEVQSANKESLMKTGKVKFGT